MKAFVLGATGFLGQHVAQALQEAGTPAVLASRRGGEISCGGEIRPVQAVDLLDEAALTRGLEGASVLYLCSGLVSRSAGDAELLHRLHVDGTRLAIQAARRAGVRRVVLASTSGTLALGTDPRRIYSEEEPAPSEAILRFPYYRSKYFGEKAALEAAQGDVEVVIGCPSLLLGPGDLRESSTGDVRRFLERAIVALPRGGIALVDVRDAARGLVLAAEKGRSGERYLLSAANLTVRAFFERLSRISGVPAPWLDLPRRTELAVGIFSIYEQALRSIGGKPPVDAESIELGQHFWYCSADKAEKELGFVARDVQETLRDTVADLIERRVVVVRRS
jgi:dihydroflavonol-4-reductase